MYVLRLIALACLLTAYVLCVCYLADVLWQISAHNIPLLLFYWSAALMTLGGIAAWLTDGGWE